MRLAVCAYDTAAGDHRPLKNNSVKTIKWDAQKSTQQKRCIPVIAESSHGTLL